MRKTYLIIALAALMAATCITPADAGPTTAQLSKRVQKLEKKVHALSPLALLETTKGDPTLEVTTESVPVFVNSQGVGTATVICTSGSATGGGFESTSAPGTVLI